MPLTVESIVLADAWRGRDMRGWGRVGEGGGAPPLAHAALCAITWTLWDTAGFGPGISATADVICRPVCSGLILVS